MPENRKIDKVRYPNIAKLRLGSLRTERPRTERLSLRNMAEHFGLGVRGRETAGKWEKGEARCNERHREQWIIWLRERLSQSPQSINQIWEAFVADWEWETLSDPIDIGPAAAGSNTEQPERERRGSVPPLPPLIIGRENDLKEIKARLKPTASIQTSGSIQVLTAMRGWPGVGKTTLAAALAHDPDILAEFPDGVLWASLGQTPSIYAELTAWARQLGVGDIAHSTSSEEVSHRLGAVLRDKRMLLIVDDVWITEDALLFRIGGRKCAILVTTRVTQVATDIAPRPTAIYRLPVLSDEDALELLRVLAPEVVTQSLDECHTLVRDLEGLPLAIQVAGRLLHSENQHGFDVSDLISELREQEKILQQRPPVGILAETSPTVAALLKKSTDHLDVPMREHFACLGVFKERPATFDREALKAVWEVDDPSPTVRVLVERGLLETIRNGRYQIHSLLVAHAQSLLAE